MGGNLVITILRVSECLEFNNLLHGLHIMLLIMRGFEIGKGIITQIANNSPSYD